MSAQTVIPDGGLAANYGHPRVRPKKVNAIHTLLMMSEYQFIHFVACDRPLDDAALEYMRRQSTRADISRWEFTNEYHFGDFRGNATEMLRRGYDVHLHFANFGIRKLMFRLPEMPCDKKTFSAFRVEHSLEWIKDKQGRAGVLLIEPESEPDTYDYLDDVQSKLERLIPLREMLLRGDLRPLYLGWLACAHDDSIEPPVPAGLRQLDPALVALAELYELSLHLLAAAAKSALAAPKKYDRQVAADQWVQGLSKAELKQIVSDLVTDDPMVVRAAILENMRQSIPATPWPTTKPARTLDELRSLAEPIQKQTEKRAAIVKKRARTKVLKAIADDPEKTIRRIDALAKKRTTRSYHEAADRLDDLVEALGDGEGMDTAREVAQRLRTRKPRSNHLIGVLRKRGYLD